ncbi:MAG: isoprenylcysteine carboxylmethyltransferase family protein [Bacteroidales bacterium]|nr:MAG: isoprenylcysteine carboxylmethyltransferase family protein [Bacteroidales bacterium]
MRIYHHPHRQPDLRHQRRLVAATHHYEILCFVVSLLGLAVRAFTVGYTPANTSGRNVAEQVADQLNTTGLYSVVRNPLYVGNFLMWLGIAMLTMNLWFIISFILLFWVYYERIIFAEEQFLTNKFGSVYTDWADKTPCFIPRLKGYVAPKLPFRLEEGDQEGEERPAGTAARILDDGCDRRSGLGRNTPHRCARDSLDGHAGHIPYPQVHQAQYHTA